MRILQADTAAAKGWYAGPWESDLPIRVGYASAGVDEPHVHVGLFEVYLVARGSATMRVEKESVELAAGDAIVIAPGEAHTFLRSSDDYFHFVVHAPKAGHEPGGPAKELVPRARLGLGSGGTLAGGNSTA